MFRIRIIILVLPLATFPAGNAQQSGQAAVYEALFAQVESLGSNKTYYVREQEGRPPNAIPEYPVQFPVELRIHAREDFGRLRVSFVEESFISGLWDAGCRAGWERFHERYPDAGDLTQVSRVLFNEQGDEASVYVEQGRNCQGSCGATYRLAAEAGVWTVIGRTGGWCS